MQFALVGYEHLFAHTIAAMRLHLSKKPTQSIACIFTFLKPSLLHSFNYTSYCNYIVQSVVLLFLHLRWFVFVNLGTYHQKVLLIIMIYWSRNFKLLFFILISLFSLLLNFPLFVNLLDFCFLSANRQT